MIRRIGEVLRLEAERDPAAEAVSRPIEIVAGVELHARLVGPDLELPSGIRLDDVRRQTRRVAGRPVQHEGVVVPVGPHHLLGRMNASYRMVLFGTGPIGAIIGGWLGSALGLRTALVITAIVLTSPSLWTLYSPVFRLKTMPSGPMEGSPS